MFGNSSPLPKLVVNFSEPLWSYFLPSFFFFFAHSTGAQGESVLHNVAATSQGQFHFRIFTKDPNSPKAKSLKEKYGNDIEFVKGSQANEADYDKLFSGATWAYIVTNFWDPAIMLKEAQIGKAMADSAKKQYVIASLSGDLFDSSRFV